MKNVTRLIAVSMLLAGSLYAQSAINTVTIKERVIDRYDVPQVVLAVFTAAYPNAIVHRYESVDTGDAMFFRIEAEDSSKRRGLTYNNVGELVKTEEYIVTSALPSDAQQVMQRDYADGEVTYAAKIIQGDRITYHVTVKKSEKVFSVNFDSAGKLVAANEVKVNYVFQRIPN